MRLIGKDKLLHFRGINEEIDTWISAWVTELSNATWFNPTDLRNSFPKVNSLEGSVFIFPICSTNYNVKVILSFRNSIALISEVITIK